MLDWPNNTREWASAQSFHMHFRLHRTRRDDMYSHFRGLSVSFPRRALGEESLAEDAPRAHLPNLSIGSFSSHQPWDWVAIMENFSRISTFPLLQSSHTAFSFLNC
jgi:hypothetical protein